MSLPIETMLRDVAIVQKTLPEDCTDTIADVCLHCVALAAEVERLKMEVERLRSKLILNGQGDYL